MNRLVYESTNIRIEQKGSGLFTAGNVTDDVTGDKNLDYSVKNAKFDYFASSMGYNLNGEKKINSIELTGKSKRLDEKYVEIYVSDTGAAEDWTLVSRDDLGFQKTNTGLKVIFRNCITTSYIKVHSTWDERDENYLPVDKAEIEDSIASIIEVFYLAEGKDSSWTYDAKGNRITSSERLGNSHSSKVIEYYSNSDLIRKYGDWYFSYDKNGNLTARGTSAVWNEGSGAYDYSSAQGELWQYEYDLSNRMTRVLFSEAGKDALKNKASYTYDYRGLLVIKVTDDYVEYREYTPDGKLLFSEKGDETTDYIYKSNTVFAEVRNRGLDEDVYYHHTDHLGTTEAITDNNGNVVWEAEYEAFGSVLNQNGTKVFTASFTGKMYDAEAGMYYFNARWYNSEIGRFVTEDLARDGIDWYAYCNNNPLRYTDPTGKYWEYIVEGDTVLKVWIGETVVTETAALSTASKFGFWGILTAICMSLQGDQIHPALPPNYEWDGCNIKAPSGNVMPNATAAWRHAEGDPDWFKTGVLSNIAAGKIAKQSTHNDNFSCLMLGKNWADGKSYVKEAEKRHATYFSMSPETWDNLSSNLHKDEMWKINEKFLNQQIKQKKDIYLSHNPSEYINTDTFYGRELQFLQKKGYEFVEDGDIWKAEKKKK